MSNTDILLETINNDMNAFISFADVHFDPLWHMSQPPLLRAALSLMADELITVARITVDGASENESFRTFGNISECAFGAIYKGMRDGIFGNILTQIGADEGADWIRRFAILPGESDCFEGITPNILCLIRAASGRSLALAISDMSWDPSLSCLAAREALFDGLSIAAQLGERATEFEKLFEGDDYIHYLQTKHEISGRLIKEAAGDGRWFATQFLQSLQQLRR